MHYASRKDATQGKDGQDDQGQKGFDVRHGTQVHRATIRTVVYREIRRQGFQSGQGYRDVWLEQTHSMAGPRLFKLLTPFCFSGKKAFLFL